MADDPESTDEGLPDEIDLARHVSHIMPHSAATDAVRRYDELAAGGFKSKIIRAGSVWLVAEPLPDDR